MSGRVKFRCYSCKTKLGASLRHVGRTCSCPKCGSELIVPAKPPEEEAPILALDDSMLRPRPSSVA